MFVPWIDVDCEQDRARRAAAAEQRLSSKKKTGAVPPSNAAGKKLSALEELSKENKGWRDADEQAALRAYVIPKIISAFLLRYNITLYVLKSTLLTLLDEANLVF